MNLNRYLILIVLIVVFAISDCNKNGTIVYIYPEVNRQDKIPNDISKRGPDTDQHPPILHSSDYEEPIPLPDSVNTAGAEDSPFILPDGNTLYFFFTPDVRVSLEQQLLDNVTGIWVSHKTGDTWSNEARVWLQQPGKLALDGSVCIQGSEMWFASSREGYTGVNMFTAEWVNENWLNWQYAGNRLMNEIQIGEVHIHVNDLYFHSNRTGGKGGFDIWVTTRDGNTWSDPINIEAVNSDTTDVQPFISFDGEELWFTRIHNGTPGIFRSLNTDGMWSVPELVLSQYAGEPTLDNAGNIYFVHHFYENGIMIEADIYVACKK
jgi:Tol biopolymer transport system component